MEWSEAIKSNIGEDNHLNLVPNFSTTTNMNNALFNCTSMNSM